MGGRDEFPPPRGPAWKLPFLLGKAKRNSIGSILRLVDIEAPSFWPTDISVSSQKSVKAPWCRDLFSDLLTMTCGWPKHHINRKKKSDNGACSLMWWYLEL